LYIFPFLTVLHSAAKGDEKAMAALVSNLTKFLNSSDFNQVRRLFPTEDAFDFG